MGKKKGRRKTTVKKSGKEEDTDLGNEEEELKAKYGDIGDDDEDLYEDEIDQFHKGKDKILLEKAGGKLLDDDASESEGEDEVLKFDDDTDDDDDESDAEMNEMIKIQMKRLKRQGKGLEADSDQDDDDDDDDVAEKKERDKAGKWGGTKSSAYYGADHVESDEEDDEDAEDAQRLEYEEAMLIQKRIESKFDDDDFGLDFFQPAADSKAVKAESEEHRLERVIADVSKLSKAERLRLLSKESPEFLGLVTDYRDTLIELRDRSQPLFELVQSGKIPSGNGADYVRLKYNVLMTYCINMSFYLMLKAKKTAVANHPVIKRLLQLKNTIRDLESLDEKFSADVQRVLKMLRDGKEIKPIEKLSRKESINMDDDDDDDDENVESDELDEDLPDELPSGGRGGTKRKKAGKSDAIEEKLKKMKKLKRADLEEEGPATAAEGGASEEKRKATKEMEKNRGLTPHKRKDLKNPRVRLREKYRKAKIRRKGAVREPRFEMEKYGGELSGIRAGLKKGIKLLS